jgi:hypothetical protein
MPEESLRSVKAKLAWAGLAVVACGAGWAFVIGYFGTYRSLGPGGTFGEAAELLSDPHPLRAMRAAAERASDLQAPKAALNVIMIGLADLVFALGLCSWIPLKADALFGRLTVDRFDRPRAGSSTGERLAGAVFVLLSLAAAAAALIVAWNVLPLIAGLGANSDLVWKGSDERVGGIGPVVGAVLAIVVVALVSLPACFGLRGVLYKEAEEREGPEQRAIGER